MLAGLRSSLANTNFASSHTGDRFEAVLDEPIVIQSQIVAPRGTVITGRVIAAKPSGHLHEPGYLRLTLASMTLNGKALPLTTSSIFVKGGSHKERTLATTGATGSASGQGKGTLVGTAAGAAASSGKQDVGLAVEHRLSFRLNEALSVEQ